MIRSFRSKAAEQFFLTRKPPKEYGAIAGVALKRLTALNAAEKLTDLLFPPGNRLEALSGDRKRQHSIRINDQYRVCFEWREGHAHQVEITKHYR